MTKKEVQEIIAKAQGIKKTATVTVQYDWADFGGPNKWRVCIDGESIQWCDVSTAERFLGVPRGTLPRFEEKKSGPRKLAA